MLFKKEIKNLQTWGELFQNIDAFEPVIEYIYKKNNLNYSYPEKCIPGSNAVFKIDKTIIKIYAPPEAELCKDMEEYKTELFSLKHANDLNIRTPKVYASGILKDKYIFPYIIMEFFDGDSLGQVENKLTNDERFSIGTQLREFTNTYDTICENKNDFVIDSEVVRNRWKRMIPRLIEERNKELSKSTVDSLYFIHADLTRDNILINDKKDIEIIDFADSCIAPIEVEYTCLIFETFRFKASYLKGYFGNYSVDEIIDICVKGLMIHEYGPNIICDNFENGQKIKSITELRKRIEDKLKTI